MLTAGWMDGCSGACWRDKDSWVSQGSLGPKKGTYLPTGIQFLGTRGEGQGKNREKAHTPLSIRQAPTLHRWQSGV